MLFQGIINVCLAWFLKQLFYFEKQQPDCWEAKHRVTGGLNKKNFHIEASGTACAEGGMLMEKLLGLC